MNLIASRCGLRLDVYARIHRWLGRTEITDGLVHTAAAASLHTPNLREQFQQIGDKNICVTICRRRCRNQVVLSKREGGTACLNIRTNEAYGAARGAVEIRTEMHY